MDFDDLDVQRELSKLATRLNSAELPSAHGGDADLAVDRPLVVGQPEARPLTPRPWDQPSATALRAEQMQVWSDSARKTFSGINRSLSTNSRSSSFSGQVNNTARLSSAGSSVTSRTGSFIAVSCSSSQVLNTSTQSADGARKLSFAVQFSPSPRSSLIVPEKELCRFSKTVKVDPAVPYDPIIVDDDPVARPPPPAAAVSQQVEAPKKGYFAKLFKRRSHRSKSS